ncbi:NADH-quinone oxidoreductase subunit M [Phycisphaerales bacterium]|nr:NADH-quinone oxidoreductase subunit M [Phycisphaerales bacterium]
MGLATIIIPLVGAAVALLLRSDMRRPFVLPFFALAHLVATIVALARPEPGGGPRWLALDAPGRIVLLLVSVLFAVCSVYAVAYLRLRKDRPNRIFCACLLAFLGMMSFITWANHLGLMWVAIETTTLSSAPLLYYNRSARSLEAAWKYLLVGSVGIALALLGSLCLGYSSLAGGHESSLLFEDLVREAPGFSKLWLHAAFILLLVGYGTKMGIAPMHTWKPDAYGEAPGLVGALLAGGMTSCAFLAIVRIFHVVVAAGEAAFASRILVFMGLFSMAVAGAFLVRQRDFKRMLAYSSVEHMGILVLALGLGPAGAFGALLHMVNNGLVKGVMFLSAGNIHRAFESKSTDEVSGAMRRLPVSGALFLAGFIAVTGSPPFAPFVSEFTILNAALGQGRYVVGGLMLVFLLVVFIGMGATVLAVVQGKPSGRARRTPFHDRPLTILPPLVLMACVTVFGLFVPPPLRAMIEDVVRFLGYPEVQP